MRISAESHPTTQPPIAAALSFPPAPVIVPRPPRRGPPPLRMRTIFSGAAEGHRLGNPSLPPPLLWRRPMVVVMVMAVVVVFVVADLKGCESGRSTDRLTQNGLQTAELETSWN